MPTSGTFLLYYLRSTKKGPNVPNMYLPITNMYCTYRTENDSHNEKINVSKCIFLRLLCPSTAVILLYLWPRNPVGTWQPQVRAWISYCMRSMKVWLVWLTKVRTVIYGQHVLHPGTQVNRTHSYSTVYNGTGKNQVNWEVAMYCAGILEEQSMGARNRVVVSARQPT